MTAKPSEPVPPWTPDSRIRTTVGTVGLLIGLIATGVFAWATLRGDVEDHSRSLKAHEQRLGTIETRAREDHDILVEIRADQKALMRELQQRNPRN